MSIKAERDQSSGAHGPLFRVTDLSNWLILLVNQYNTSLRLLSQLIKSLIHIAIHFQTRSLLQRPLLLKTDGDKT